MFSISKLLSTSYRAITASSAAILLSGIMISSAGAADIATTYNNSCAACHDSGALNAIKKGDSAKWQIFSLIGFLEFNIAFSESV